MEKTESAAAPRPTAFGPDWLAERRWFRSKARRLVGVTVDDAVELDPAGARLLVLRARSADGGEDRYLVPAVAGPEGELREPRDGDGAWRGIVAAVAAGAPRQGESGRLEFHATSALAELVPGGGEEAAGLEERQLGVEQSNTSVRLGDALMLKVYRLLEAGTNPEVELNAFLTEVGFEGAPPLLGWGTYAQADEEPATAVMLQGLVASRGDGWQWLLGRLADPPHGPVAALAGVAVIGGITAQMHAALASRPEAPGFEVRHADASQLRAWRERAERELDAALDAVSGADLDRLEAVAGSVRGRFAAIERASAPITSRIHGDYHLGQLLRTDTSFMVVDFEGEPARPLAERRAPASPLRDVAGMLRSLDYAARTAERAGGGGFVPDEWLSNARSAFLSAYGASPAHDEELLLALEAEKACYEVRYEANNRPGWTWLPIAALERMAS